MLKFYWGVSALSALLGMLYLGYHVVVDHTAQERLVAAGLAVAWALLVFLYVRAAQAVADIDRADGKPR